MSEWSRSFLAKPGSLSFSWKAPFDVWRATFQTAFHLLSRILKAEMYTSKQKERKEMEQDFSQPWEKSDLVLWVEEQPLHVHRLILSMSSPVFSRMFSGDFKERTARTIPLPGKKYYQVREMLLVIYPTAWKSVNDHNWYFLLTLAHEYQMTQVIKRCESYLQESVAHQKGYDILELLVVAQTFDMEEFLDVCIKKTESLSIEELKRHKAYKEIDPISQQKMIELQMDKVRKENSRLKNLAREAFRSLESIVRIVGNHAISTSGGLERKAHCYPLYPSIEEMLQRVMNDKLFDDRKGRCQSLHAAYHPLETLASTLNDMRF